MSFRQFLHVGTLDIWSWLIFCCGGDFLFPVGCSAGSMPSTRRMPACPSSEV